jgi:VIT1/CCC1 family predicted Fe2+/Mn2+ transporter
VRITGPVQPLSYAIDAAGGRAKRVLEPSERTAEVLFGLIMVLTFTGSLSVTEAGRDDVRAMLVGALGCNLAWGLIDGILFLMGALAERSRDLAVYHAVRHAPDRARAVAAIEDALPPVVAAVVQPSELEQVRQRLNDLPAPPARARLTRSDWHGALAVCLLVFLSTFPVALPFMLAESAARALRLSNGVAIAMLFVTGAAYGRSVGRSPWMVGVSMVLLGAMLVALTIALGG